MNPPLTLLLADTGLHPIDYLIVFAYLLAMIGIGWRLSRKQETVEEFFVAGRKMPWLATGLSMIATLMSTLTYLGSPGEVIQYGIGQSISLLALPFAFAVVYMLWVPFFMRLRLTSAYEYIERRFGTTARMLTVTLYLFLRFLWMGAIVFTASSAVAQITQDTAPGAIEKLTLGLVKLTPVSWFYTVLIITGLASTLYTMLGGISAVIWTDVLQFIILFLGAVATLIVVAFQTGTGPTTWWHDATAVYHPLPQWATWDLGTRVTITWSLLSGFFWHVCTHASDQVALQRYFTTESAVAARRTALVNYVLDCAMQCLLTLVGMALLTYYLRHTNELPEGITDPRSPEFADKIFPRFIAYGLPVGVSGLVVAALFAVAQSSIDSGINSTATVITVDVLRRFRKQQLDSDTELRHAQWLTLGIGLFVTAAALAVALLPARYNLIDLQFKSFNCVLGPLGAIFMAGMLLRHVGERAVVIAGLLGTVSGFLFAFMDLIPGWTAPTAFLIIPLSWLVTFLTAAVLGGILQGPRPDQLKGLTLRE